MALRLGVLCGRQTKVYLPLCLGAFLLGILFGLLMFCSYSGTSTPHVKEEMSLNVGIIPPTTEEIETTETSSMTDKPAITEKPTIMREPYPPLLQKKDLIITPNDCPRDLFLLVMVVTSSRNFEARKSIRNSWGEDNSKKNETSGESFRVIYVVGSDYENDRLVKRESKRYKDILRGGFKDVYSKNEVHSVKMLFGLKWVTISCKAKYILKTTAEGFVNTAGMISFLSKNEDTQSGLYMGFCHGKNVGSARVVRNPNSPWYISEDEWPEKHLPPYASSMGITLSYDVVDKIVELSIKEKLLHIDDVYIGIIANKLSIKCKDESTKFDTSYNTMLTECEDMNFCVIGGVPSKDMLYLNQNIKNLKDIC